MICSLLIYSCFFRLLTLGLILHATGIYVTGSSLPIVLIVNVRPPSCYFFGVRQKVYIANRATILL